MSDMKQAETYVNLMAICPHCSHHQEVEWAESCEDALREYDCDLCKKEFSYCHESNDYGLNGRN
jgi:hypothetical protein